MRRDALQKCAAHTLCGSGQTPARAGCLPQPTRRRTASSTPCRLRVSVLAGIAQISVFVRPLSKTCAYQPPCLTNHSSGTASQPLNSSVRGFRQRHPVCRVSRWFVVKTQPLYFVVAPIPYECTSRKPWSIAKQQYVVPCLLRCLYRLPFHVLLQNSPLTIHSSGTASQPLNSSVRAHPYGIGAIPSHFRALACRVASLFASSCASLPFFRSNQFSKPGDDLRV